MAAVWFDWAGVIWFEWRYVLSIGALETACKIRIIVPPRKA
jgi:hypothetical protein